MALMVASAKRGKRKGKKSFVYKKESFGKKEKCCFLCFAAYEKKGRCFFSPSAQKKISSTSKHFSGYITRYEQKLSQKVLVTFTKVISEVSQVLFTVYYLISKELQLRRHFWSSASASSSYMIKVIVSQNQAFRKR
jgi:hypothetical protein